MVKQLDHTLQDSFEYQGLWWLPESSEVRLSGILAYNPDEGCKLSLVGSFEKFPPHSDASFYSQIINGITVNGIRCTLVENFGINQTFHSPGMQTQEIRTNLLLLGEIFSSEEQMRFSVCNISLEHLEEWMKPSPFEYTIVKDDGAIIGAQVKVISRKAFEVDLNTINASFSLTNRYRSSAGSAMETVLLNEAFIRIQPAVPANFETYRNWVTDITRLVAIAIGENSWLRKFHLTIMESESSEDEDTRKKFPISVFFRAVSGVKKDKLLRVQMLLDFDKFIERLPQIADSWLGAGHRLQSVKDLFFLAMYSEITYLEYRFLSLVHALESYHRALFGNTFFDQDKKKKYYLRKRLEQLLSDLDKDLCALITDAPKSFIEQIVITRNYYVHFDEGLKAKALNHDDMFLVLVRLGLFVRIILLREIGFSNEEIYELLKKKQRFLPWDREE